MRMAFFGGLYSNYLALDRAIQDARRRGAERLYCLGDLGAFGPYPDRVFPLLKQHQVECIQGNYDHSIGNGLEDCQCGYTDPRDNHFARISYRYTYDNTSDENREWMRDLPPQRMLEIDGLRILLCHGSPRKTNEFLWESSTSTAFLNRLADQYAVDAILCTHTGIHWARSLSQDRLFANVGVLGRPENDGTPKVWYALMSTGEDSSNLVPDSPGLEAAEALNNPSVSARQQAEPGQGEPGQGAEGAGLMRSLVAGRHRASGGKIALEFVCLAYDHQRLAAEMRTEGLPEEFVQTTLTGWWTTCLEVLPGKERARGRF